MITPLDIENKKFSKRALNGYSTEEVDDFLDELTIDYEKLYKEVGEYKQTVDKQNVELEKYKQMESTLQNAAEEIKNVARQQADAILNEAQTAARDQLTSIDTNMEAKQRELEELQRRIDEYKSQAEALLISQLELLKGNANNFNAI